MAPHWCGVGMTETDGADAAATHKNLNESVDKLRYETKLTRGTGTRDQDTHKIKVRGETPEEVADQAERLVDALRERDVFSGLREVGNTGDDDE